MMAMTATLYPPVKQTAQPLATEALQGCDVCQSHADQLLATTSLVAWYRPVADLGGGIFGHLASAHVRREHLPWSFARLVGMARQLGRLHALIEAALAAMVSGFVRNHGQGQLLLPLPPGCGDILGRASADVLARALEAVALPASRVIVIHPGVLGLAGAQAANARAAARALRELGVGLAASTFDCQRSKHLLWADLPPDYVLTDDGLFADLDANLIHIQRYLTGLRAELGAGTDAERAPRVICMGVGSPAALKLLQEIDVGLAVGDFVGKPFAVPTRTLSVAAHRAIVEAGADVGRPARPAADYVLEKMLIKIPPVQQDTLTDEVFARFEREPDQRAIAVVKDGAPIGLISRYDMLDNMARPFRHELFGRKRCTRFMDAEPLIVSVQTSLLELSEILANAHPRHLISGFIITDGGAYLGMGAVQDLVREITSMQMNAAKYANPLTQLPGNVPINEHIDSLLATREHAAICYCDLDNFKPFNDVYGYVKGDDVIRLTARILSDVCDPELDFIGHIGGDDFVLVFRSKDWAERCERALKVFGQEILGFFSHDDIERGGYLTENRKGKIEFHGLTALSIGAMEVTPGMFSSHLAVAVVTAEVKKKAKAIKGNSFYCNRRTYEDDGRPASVDTASGAPVELGGEIAYLPAA